MTYNISTTWTIALVVLVIWELAWKGIAMWQAAKRGQRNWYITMLVLNTAGILPIVYLLMHLEHPEVKENSHEKAISVHG